MLTGRHVVVGISGGIAAYKAAELVRLLVKEGAEVQVVMTAAAKQFITPLTLQSLSGRAVANELFDLGEEAAVGHIRIADRADLVVIAPATADLIARLAAGLAGDLLSTVVLATKAPLLLAPAMNVNMWEHPQTQDNLRRLVERGVRTVGPDAGPLACGWIGSGRLIEPPVIAAACAAILAPGDLAGRTILVTAGPTHEPLDPVRFLGNRSSGKMGFALAARAAARGARVLLIAGPVALPTPPGVERTDVESALQMQAALLGHLDELDVVIKAAAVADFRPAAAATDKIKKRERPSLTLELVENPDLLAELGARRRAGHPRPLLVGFAAETRDLEAYARRKLVEKGCHLLVGNDVSEPGVGFGSDDNRVVIVGEDGSLLRTDKLPKLRLADQILDRVAALLPPGLGRPQRGSV